MLNMETHYSPGASTFNGKPERRIGRKVAHSNIQTHTIQFAALCAIEFLAAEETLLQCS